MFDRLKNKWADELTHSREKSWKLKTRMQMHSVLTSTLSRSLLALFKQRRKCMFT